ncbi:LTA synthase family protein [Enterococcus cecorum]|uniref:LTA synthase family protein n=1 Tax=Enterococcus cecorum TaxID=44008 RepID=UPI001F053F94|nr:LTA synthase family protein [Enterococcus cecorum]
MITSAYLVLLKIDDPKLHHLFRFVNGHQNIFCYFVYLTVPVSIFLIVYALNNKEYYTQEKTLKIMDKIFVGIFTFCSWIALLCILSANWAMNHFQGISINQIIFTMTQPVEGTDQSQIDSYIVGPLMQSLFYIFILIFIIYCINRLTKLKKGITVFEFIRFKKLLMSVLSILILISGFFISINEIGYAEVKSYFFEKSGLYEKAYINPEKVKLTFPEKKRNLIYIFMESMETTYISKDLGGAQKENLLPNLTNRIQSGEAINFSNTDTIGGALPIRLTGFTVGGMVAQSAGVPVRTSLDNNTLDNNSNYQNLKQFLPGAYSLGDILEKNGYQNLLLLGSDANFGGRKTYFQQHGNYQILDYNYAIENKWIPSDYHVWWGYEDKKLFENAKNVVTQAASSDKPFNLTMLTADTHFEDGYMSAETPKLYDTQYSNVIHYSDQLVNEFINWVQQQPFYENTTIVISGDHLSMDKDYFNDISDKYQRTVFNEIINSPVQAENAKNRQFTTFDLYPTTLAALGVEIEGNCLGLGTNLFSGTKTVPERLGYQNFEDEVTKKSDYYDQKIAKDN